MLLPESKEFELCPAGTHFGRCYQVVDLGQQKVTYDGVTSLKHKVQIGWELPHELMKDGRPFAVFQIYNWTMSPKGNLRPDLESWRGKPFTEADLRGPNRFDIRKLIGVGATLSVIHAESSDGTRTYANVKSVSALPKGTDLPPAVNKVIYLSLDPDDFDPEMYQALHKVLREKIALSPEYQKIIMGHEVDVGQTMYGDDLSDPVPF